MLLSYEAYFSSAHRNQRWTAHTLYLAIVLSGPGSGSAIQDEHGKQREISRKGDRMNPFRPSYLSLLDVQRDPAGMFVEVDDVLNVER